MRTRLGWWVGGVVLTGGLALFPLVRGQEQPARTSTAPAPAGKEPTRVTLDPAKMTPLQRQFYLSAQRGADWLSRSNRADGRFAPGHQPALGTVAEGENYLHQIETAAALARAARFTGNDRHLARARQAVLALLVDTAPDPQDARARHTTLPAVVANPVGAAGLLVQAVHELPAPGSDLIEQSDQLCVFIARRQRPDGALSSSDGPNDPRKAGAEALTYAGQALAGLMASQRHRPAPWKTEVVRKALPYYRAKWKAQPIPEPVPWLTAAFADAYVRTKDKAFADAVFEMSDWVCDLQYTGLDPRHPLWSGGFMAFQGGKPAAAEPSVNGAALAAGLVEACRAARQAGDVPRYQRYETAARACLQFLTTLQFTEANTKHYADWYKPALLGGFHATHQDGNLRLEATARAVGALVGYLSEQ